MKTDIQEFREAHQAKVIELYETDGMGVLSLYCACSMCPVLAAYTFCKEKYPDDEVLTDRIDKVKIFYGVTEIVG
jgi:hypothetical protein